jgi:hypothetical protein
MKSQHLLYLPLLFAAQTYAAPPDDAAHQDWGYWNHPTEASEHATPEKRRYGTGIAGSAENQLHRLDDSYLLDYQKSLDNAGELPTPPGSEIPDEIIGTEMQQGAQE